MRPARTYPDRRDDVRLLVIDPAAPEGAGLYETRTPALPELLAPGDLLVVNDAATLPGSLRGTDEAGRPIEARLVAARGAPSDSSGHGQSPPARFAAVLFGAGDWHTRTEDRPPPPELADGARLRFGALAATVARHATLSPRLVELRFDLDGDALWAALYREGRPVQYSHLAHDLPLWAVQTVYAARPWAFEMPSAGRPLSWEILLALRRRGVRWASLTHAAGLSATGDPAHRRRAAARRGVRDPRRDRARRRRDARPRRPRRRRRDDRRARARGRPPAGRPGDESAGARRPRRDRPAHHPGPSARASSTASCRARTPRTRATSSCWPRSRARTLLAAAAAHAERAGFLTHELGDSMLVLPGALAGRASRASA